MGIVAPARSDCYAGQFELELKQRADVPPFLTHERGLQC
jgi:hypothetical protein